MVHTKVEEGANLYPNSFPAYEGLNEDYIHAVINYTERYVDGQVRTNGIENF